MSKDLNISYLMDFYGQLLTQKQLDALTLYYNEDLSLAEIAGELGISRQGVRDFIKRGEAQLAELEQKLGLGARFLTISAKLSETERDIAALCEKESGAAAEELRRILREIKQIQQIF